MSMKTLQSPKPERIDGVARRGMTHDWTNITLRQSSRVQNFQPIMCLDVRLEYIKKVNSNAVAEERIYVCDLYLNLSVSGVKGLFHVQTLSVPFSLSLLLVCATAEMRKRRLWKDALFLLKYIYNVYVQNQAGCTFMYIFFNCGASRDLSEEDAFRNRPFCWS